MSGRSLHQRLKEQSQWIHILAHMLWDADVFSRDHICKELGIVPETWNVWVKKGRNEKRYTDYQKWRGRDVEANR